MCAQTFMCAKRSRFKHLGMPTVAAAVAVLMTATPAAAGLFGSKPKPAAIQAKPAATPATALAAKAEANPPARKATAEQRTAAERLDPLARAAFWGREVQADPTDVEAGVSLSKALRAMERYE